MSWFDPLPWDAPLRLPRQMPKVVVPSYIRDAGQVLNLLLHHGAGAVARDYSGRGNDGSIFLGVAWLDDSWGWALDFDGATGYLTTPITGFSAAAGTLEFWMRFVHNAATQFITGSATNFIRTYVNNQDRFWVDLGGANWINSGVLTPLVWYHIVGRWWGANLDLYVDNTFQMLNAAVAIPAPASPFYIGSNVGPAGYANVDLAFIRMYDRVIAVAEIADHFEKLRSIFGV